MKNSKWERKPKQNILYGEGKGTDELKVTAKACSGREGTVVKISVLGKCLFGIGINNRLPSVKSHSSA